MSYPDAVSVPGLVHSPLSRLRKYLPDHVHACETTDYVVLLDLRRNRYMGLSPEDLGALLTFLERHEPQTCSDVSSASTLGAGKKLAEDMMRLGMLRETASMRPPPRVPPVVSSLHEGIVPFRAPIALSHLSQTTLALFAARRALWIGSVEIRVHKSKGRAYERRGLNPVSTDDLRNLVATYVHCRAWLFTASGECLLDSLVLHDFLSRYGIASSLIVGVRTAPFGAHAWVQKDGLVLNDQLEIVRAYTCIYASGCE